ncbi:hypothetical protein ACFPK9_01265 [Rubritalea spongiae]|uniref:Glycosyl hydrolase family 98 putative carbohydrate-binding module domain-containing protein n=1 Tax=Rubritalea spongiae TaxID=430797 RepID=A0ABW5E0S3_9BACT
MADFTVSAFIDALMVSQSTAQGRAALEALGVADLVDDLTTGGSNKALTAEQGKVLKALVDELKSWADSTSKVLYDEQLPAVVGQHKKISLNFRHRWSNSYMCTYYVSIYSREAQGGGRKYGTFKVVARTYYGGSIAYDVTPLSECSGIGTTTETTTVDPSDSDFRLSSLVFHYTRSGENPGASDTVQIVVREMRGDSSYPAFHECDVVVEDEDHADFVGLNNPGSEQHLLHFQPYLNLDSNGAVQDDVELASESTSTGNDLSNPDHIINVGQADGRYRKVDLSLAGWTYTEASNPQALDLSSLGLAFNTPAHGVLLELEVFGGRSISAGLGRYWKRKYLVQFRGHSTTSEIEYLEMASFDGSFHSGTELPTVTLTADGSDLMIDIVDSAGGYDGGDVYRCEAFVKDLRP